MSGRICLSTRPTGLDAYSQNALELPCCVTPLLPPGISSRDPPAYAGNPPFAFSRRHLAVQTILGRFRAPSNLSAATLHALWLPRACAPRLPGRWSVVALRPPHRRLQTQLSRDCHTRHVPASAFRTLSPGYSPRNLPALFRAGNARELQTFRVYPPEEPDPLSRIASSLGVGRSRHTREGRRNRLDSRGLLPSGIRAAVTSCYTRPDSRYPPGLNPL
jgi:hypothetical protein